MDSFFLDCKNFKEYTYDNLLSDINNTNSLNQYILTDDIYLLFLKIIVGIVNEVEVTILDHDLSSKELTSLGINEKALEEKTIINSKKKFNHIDDLLYQFKKNAAISSIVIYTSGTTGRPKKVRHYLKNLIRTVKHTEKCINNIWGLAYNPAHFAGIQVFLQAFFNKNTIVNIFQIDIRNVADVLNEYKVTNLSATPTFYRMLIRYMCKTNNYIQCITFGGEKYDELLMVKLKEVFPKAKVVNIYASTEAGAILKSDGNEFIIDEKDNGKISFSSENELLIHKSLLGNSDDVIINGDWYYTGDIVEFTDKSHKKFYFISRKSEMINVGGYKVNPNEVEKLILEIDGVNEALVYGRKNRLTGSIVVADIVVDNSVNKSEIEKDIDNYLIDKLQEWKRPRILNFVNCIKTTRSGKKVRK